MANPKNKCIKCFTKKENVLLEPTARLLAALYTGKKENIANNVAMAHIARSPFICLNMFPIVFQTFPRRGKIN